MVGVPDMTVKKLLPTQAMDTCRLTRVPNKRRGCVGREILPTGL
jgi:hypothetical protein